MDSDHIEYRKGNLIHLPTLRSNMVVDGGAIAFYDEGDYTYSTADLITPTYLVGGGVINGAVSYDYRCWQGGEEDDPKPELAE